MGQMKGGVGGGGGGGLEPRPLFVFIKFTYTCSKFREEGLYNTDPEIHKAQIKAISSTLVDLKMHTYTHTDTSTYISTMHKSCYNAYAVILHHLELDRTV